MPEFDELLRQPRDNPFRTAIEFRRYTFCERGYLRDPHSGAYFEARHNAIMSRGLNGQSRRLVPLPLGCYGVDGEIPGLPPHPVHRTVREVAWQPLWNDAGVNACRARAAGPTPFPMLIA